MCVCVCFCYYLTSCEKLRLQKMFTLNISFGARMKQLPNYPVLQTNKNNENRLNLKSLQRFLFVQFFYEFNSVNRQLIRTATRSQSETGTEQINARIINGKIDSFEIVSLHHQTQDSDVFNVLKLSSEATTIRKNQLMLWAICISKSELNDVLIYTETESART